MQESASEPLSPGVLHSLDALSWQRTVFAETLRRQALRRLEPTWPHREVRLHVVRNQPFEFVENALGTFLSFARIQARFTFGPYDDSLAQPAVGMPGDVHAVIVWLRFDHYGALSPEGLSDWLADRVAAVRAETTVPILVANWASGERARDFNACLTERLACGSATSARSASGLATPTKTCGWSRSADHPYLIRQRWRWRGCSAWYGCRPSCCPP